jgi:pyridoxal phosphate enzyme (YggS family)
LLATKTQPPERILEAMQHGPFPSGENQVQELVEKAPALDPHKLERHLIGHLQSNKAGKALDHVTCIQSIDRLSIAEKLNRLCDKRERTLDVFLQFNTSGEASKFGMNPKEAPAFARAVAALPNLRIRGLMTVGLLAPHVVLSRDSLRLLRKLRDRISAEGIERVELRHLSMGMSADLELAIEEGSTMVRVGTDVFGKRDVPAGSYWPEKAWAHLG